MYDLIEGPNGSTIIDIAVPGLRREDLEATLEDGLLKIKCISSDPLDKSKVIKKGIREFKEESFILGNALKVDMITYDSGILRVLVSKRLELGSKIAIQ